METGRQVTRMEIRNNLLIFIQLATSQKASRSMAEWKIACCYRNPIWSWNFNAWSRSDRWSLMGIILFYRIRPKIQDDTSHHFKSSNKKIMISHCKYYIKNFILFLPHWHGTCRDKISTAVWTNISLPCEKTSLKNSNG